MTDSDDPADHLRTLVDALAPALPRIGELRAGSSISAGCTVVQRIEPGRFGYSLDASVLMKILPVVDWLDVSYIVDAKFEFKESSR